MTPVSAAVLDPDLDQVYGEAVTGGPLGQVLDLGVTSGSQAAPRPGQIAVSALEAGSGALNVHPGSEITVYLPDGTPYRATVSAIYDRSLASGDLLIPASVAAGHTGTPPGYSQILVSGGTPADWPGSAPPGCACPAAPWPTRSPRRPPPELVRQQPDPRHSRRAVGGGPREHPGGDDG